MVSGIVFVELHVAGAMVSFPPGHGIARIDRKIQDHLLHLAGICFDPPQRGRRQNLHFNIFSDQAISILATSARTTFRSRTFGRSTCLRLKASS